MDKILMDAFYKMGFELDTFVEPQILMKHIKSGMVCELIPPHEGNDFKWLIRAEFIEVFDKWGNAPYWGYLDELSALKLSDLVYDLTLLTMYKKEYLEGSEDFEKIKFRLTNY